MADLLKNPALFNYVIMTLYCMNAARWAIHGNWSDTFYWLSAMSITCVVTFGYKH